MVEIGRFERVFFEFLLRMLKLPFPGNFGVKPLESSIVQFAELLVIIVESLARSLEFV